MSKQYNFSRVAFAAIALFLMSGFAFAVTWHGGIAWLDFGVTAAENSAVNTSEKDVMPDARATSETAKPIQIESSLVPTLGNYPSTLVALSENTTVTPDAAPTGAASINVSTDSNFKGTFAAAPVTGAVRITNAHPAGTYTVTVRAFDATGMASRTFTLTVGNGTFCNGTIQFTNAPDVPSGPNGTPDVAVGDFNNDGIQDLAAANNSANSVSIRLGNGSGGFSGTTEVSVGGGPLSVAAGDFNNDGNQDFATANNNGSTVSIRLGNGAGGFSGTTDVNVGTTPQVVVIGDFNNDGNQDFAVTNFFGNSVNIRLGDGLGGFTGTTIVPVGGGTAGAANPFGIALGDFNNDGNQDFAVANSFSNPPPGVTGTVSVRLGDGTGNFNAASDVPIGNGIERFDPLDIVVGDFDNNGIQDFAVT
ncbi:MAG: FG-GAP-like repeat-containing protein, partial [Pyrinomonadaceae bacterium]